MSSNKVLIKYMPKKKINEDKKIEVAKEVKTQISHLSASFGQEDLNKMVEKINEIISHLNSVL